MILGQFRPYRRDVDVDSLTVHSFNGETWVSKCTKVESTSATPAQVAWQLKVEKQGYKHIVVRSLEQFKQEISEYLSKNLEIPK